MNNYSVHPPLSLQGRLFALNTKRTHVNFDVSVPGTFMYALKSVTLRNRGTDEVIYGSNHASEPEIKTQHAL